ncbi:MAG TPA: hypothetical protein VFW35_02270 [Sphingomicrobium sp.]|nr:hypothetical protein [Sphingomicrobium sp.]
MAVFQPKFVDLVRNFTTTVGTSDFVLGPAVNGFTGFAAALKVGDSFYYSALGVDKPAETEVGRGTLLANGIIARGPISGAKTNFSSGTKSIALIAAAEWFANGQALAASVSPVGQSLISAASASDARTALALGSASLLDGDPDSTFAADSDSKVPTQKAVKTYVDTHSSSAAGGTLLAANNLSDLASASAARTNLGVTGGFTAIVASRAALANLGSSQASAYLEETGREGTFVWSSANNSANVTADPQQGIYVAPASDPTGASGAWVRKFSGALDIRWFGGAGDAFAPGTGTSNTAALNGALAVGALLPGCEILFPITAGHYRFSTAPNEITVGIELTGQGWHENPGIVGGTSYPIPQNYTGSVLRFDADVKGLTFSAFTDNAANATAFEFQSASQSLMRDIMLVSMGGTGTISHGLDLYVPVQCHNVRVHGFAGNGVNLAANTAGTGRYGSTDGSQFFGCQFDENKLHGAYLDGDDDNVVSFYGCSFRLNGGCGSLDTTTVGVNSFRGCHYATNNQSHPSNNGSAFSTAQRTKVLADAPCLSDQFTGSAVQYCGKVYDNTDIGNSSSYDTVYVEGGEGSKARLRYPTTVIGGFLANVGNRHTEYNAQTWNGDNLFNVVNFTNHDRGASFNFTDAHLNVTQTDSTIPTITLTPTSALFSELKMLGTGGAASLGLDIVAGNGGSYFSCNGFNFRDASQTLDYGTWDNNQFRVGPGLAFKMNATTIFNSSGVLQAAGVPTFAGGDVTSAGGSLTLTIGANAVTYSKFQQVAASTLVGNPTGALANAQGITLAADHSFSGTTLQIGAFSGDITKAAGSLVTAIAANAVTFSKFVAATAAGVVGASAAGNFSQLGLAGGLGVSGGNLTINGAISSATSVTIAGAITSSGGGVGYATGAGGTVTQTTSKSTAVTLNKLCGQITMNAAALAASTTVSFTLTDSFIGTGDLLILNHVSGGTPGSYALNAQCGAGTATINVRNISGSSLSEAIVIAFAVHKAVTA